MKSISYYLDYPRGVALLCLATVLLGLILSFWIMPSPDDSRYIRDALVMSECMKNGHWFGDEDVGEHGFLFKFPVALIYMITGPSVLVANIFTVLLCVGCVLLAYRFFRHSLHSHYWALVGAWLLVSNCQIIRMLPTFSRSAPLLLCCIFLYDCLIRRRSRWILGLSLLLLLDAKESTFFVFSPVLGGWILFDAWKNTAAGSWIRIAATRLTAAFLPSATWLVLMFCTSAIPINMWNANMLGLTTKGMHYMAYHFSSEHAVENVWDEENTVSFGHPDDMDSINPAARLAVKAITTAAGYIGKLLYPQTFSLASIPKPVALIAIVMSIMIFRRRTHAPWHILCLLLWFYLAIFLLRKSHARYLMPIIPLFTLFFVFFIKNCLHLRRLPWTLWICSVLLVIAGFMFDPNLKKIFILFIVLWLLAMAIRQAQYHLKQHPHWNYLLTVILGLLTVLYALQFSIRHPLGTIRNVLDFGPNAQVKAALSVFPEDQSIWLNNAGWNSMPAIYRRQPRETAEWHWSLRTWIPKKYLLNEHISRVHAFSWKNPNDFRTKLREKQVRHIGLSVSTLDNRTFPLQNKLWNLMDERWLHYDGCWHLKNKDLHIFKVIPYIAPLFDSEFHSVTLHFPIRVETNNLNAHKLSVNGHPTVEIMVHTPQTIEFILPELPPGLHSISFDDNAFTYQDGTPVAGMNFTIGKDIEPPDVLYCSLQNEDELTLADDSLFATPNTFIHIVFSEPLKRNPASKAKLLSVEQGRVKALASDYNEANQSLVLAYHLQPNQTYILILPGGDRYIEDRAGNDLKGDYRIYFRTESINEKSRHSSIIF